MSIRRPIAPEVKMKTDLGRSKPARNALLTAPPAPKRPAKKPERTPPVIAFLLEALAFQFGLKNIKAT